MLGPIETLLTDRLRIVLDAGTEVLAGPAVTPPRAPRVQVLARHLQRQLPPAGEELPALEPAWLSRCDRLSPDAPPPGGDGRGFTLPAAALPVIEEVQSPAGRIAIRGDDYSVEGRTLYFPAAPAGPVHVLTRGGPAQGWRERAPVMVRMDVTCLAPDVVTADGLINTALAAGLDALAGQEVVTLAWADGPGLRIRLLGLRVVLFDISRDTEMVGESRWARCTAGLHLRGDLETMLMQGEALEAGVIRHVETDLHIIMDDRDADVR